MTHLSSVRALILKRIFNLLSLEPPNKGLSCTHVLGSHVASGRDKIDLRPVLESLGVGSSDELCESKILQDLDEQGPALSLNY